MRLILIPETFRPAEPRYPDKTAVTALLTFSVYVCFSLMTIDGLYKDYAIIYYWNRHGSVIYIGAVYNGNWSGML